MIRGVVNGSYVNENQAVVRPQQQNDTFGNTYENIELRPSTRCARINTRRSHQVDHISVPDNDIITSPDLPNAVEGNSPTNRVSSRNEVQLSPQRLAHRPAARITVLPGENQRIDNQQNSVNQPSRRLDIPPSPVITILNRRPQSELETPFPVSDAITVEETSNCELSRSKSDVPANGLQTIGRNIRRSATSIYARVTNSTTNNKSNQRATNANNVVV